MASSFSSYIPKVYVESHRNNDDIITVETEYLSPEGDVYVLDKRTVSPLMLPTTQSIEELKPEVSDVYPYKIATPLDDDGATILLSPSIKYPVTASQNYYVPVYFELYKKNVLEAIDRRFTELDENGLIDLSLMEEL